MSLSAGLNIARSALDATSTEAAVLARNISSANQEGYSRRTAVSGSIPGSGTSIVVVERSVDVLLQERLSQVTSRAAGHQAFLNPLNQLQTVLGEPGAPNSIASLLGAFETALQLFSDNPADDVRARLTVSAAKDVTQALNAASQSVQQARQSADTAISQSVQRINDLLGEFENLNREITSSAPSGRDLNDQLDARDQILAQLSEEIGIRTANRDNFGIAIYTDGGVTLFDKSAREVFFAPKSPLGPGESGNTVYADGVAVTGSDAVLPIRSGRLHGLAQFRDDASITIQHQLDEVARGLIETFAESDISGGSSPDITGLFSYDDSPAVPASGIIIAGLASQISVSATADPEQGGNPFLLRDGGIAAPGNPAYTRNATGAAGFADHLLLHIDALQEERSFDASALAGDSGSVFDFVASTVSWLEGTRAQATSEAQYQATLQSRAAAAFTNSTGVNVDEELAALLELERSYEATARILSSIDEMFNTLFAAFR